MFRKTMLLAIAFFSFNQTQALTKYEKQFSKEINEARSVVDQIEKEEKQIFKVLSLEENVKVKEVLHSFHKIDLIEKTVKTLNKNILKLRKLNEKEMGSTQDTYLKNTITNNNKDLYALEKKTLAFAKNNKQLKLYIQKSAKFSDAYRLYKKQLKLNRSLKTFLIGVIGVALVIVLAPFVFFSIGLGITGLGILGAKSIILAYIVVPLIVIVAFVVIIAAVALNIILFIAPFYYGIQAIILYNSIINIKLNESDTFVPNQSTEADMFIVTNDSIVLADGSVSSFFYRIRKMITNMFKSLLG